MAEADPGRKPQGEQEADLKSALELFSERHDFDSRRFVYAALLESRLYLPQASHPRDGSRESEIQLPPGQEIRIITIRNRQDMQAVAAFSDLQSMVDWTRSQVQYLALMSRDLFRLAAANGFESVLINPGSETSVELNLEEVRMLADGILPDSDVSADPLVKATIPGKMKMRVRQVEPELRVRIEQLLGSAGILSGDRVAEIYLFEAQIDHGDPHPVIGIVFDGIPSGQEVDVFAKRFQTVLASSQVKLPYFDIMSLEGGILDLVRRAIPPLISGQSA